MMDTPVHTETPRKVAAGAARLAADSIALEPQEQTLSTLCIPAPIASSLAIRLESLNDRSNFGKRWQTVNLSEMDANGCFTTDFNALSLADGIYEYELLVNGVARPAIADPFLTRLTKFGGYRGTIIIRRGKVVPDVFDWSDEIPAGVQLPENNKIVVYEMPLHWMSRAEGSSQVGLGTFEKLVFEHLDELHALGINAIELLPAQDSEDTLNWGYGTRFFFVPDWDLGTPIDMKYFIKCCHQYGMRVIMDIVMNHSRACPLESLAEDWFYLPKGSQAEGAERQDWGGRLFRYATPVSGKYQARELMYQMASYWIREYHIDGFRIDEWKGINNWDFLQEFRDRARADFNTAFPGRPFIVIGEDSWRRPEITGDHAYNDHPLVDAIWNFDFRDELRRLLNNSLDTVLGQPGRYDRIQNMISGRRVWDDMDHQYRPNGFTDLAKAVNYVTSHDVADYHGQRLMNFYLGEILRYRNLLPAGVSETAFIKSVVDSIASQPAAIQASHSEALERIGSSFALMLTSVGIPMFLAGEEFADVHDLEFSDPDLKQTDPVDFERSEYLGHKNLLLRVGELIRLRTQHLALQRNELDFFYAHPTIDDSDGVRVFAYCRTGGQSLGTAEQVIVIANAGSNSFYGYDIPWVWSSVPFVEHGRPDGASIPQRNGSVLTVSLAPFQVRVFAT